MIYDKVAAHTMKIEQIARMTHEMNRRWCQLIGDDSQVAWEDAPQWQKDSAIAGVRAVLSGEANTPEEQHQCWLDLKNEEGWVYGPVKDPEKKTHPCMVPYAELPAYQRVKDSIFRAVVLAHTLER